METESNIKIRPFQLDDYDKLISLWDESELPYRPNGRDSRDKIENELKFECTVALVAEHEGKLIGSIWGTHDGRKGWLNRLAVAPEFRDRGIAKCLKSWGMLSIKISSIIRNGKMLRFDLDSFRINLRSW